MLALQLWNHIPLGWAAITPVPMVVSKDLFRIQVEGLSDYHAELQDNVNYLPGAYYLATLL